MSRRCSRLAVPAFVVSTAAALLAPTASATVTVSGTIAADTTWARTLDPIWQVTGSVTVNPGVTLTIAPGVTVKFNAFTKLTVNGTLTAVGKTGADSTIYFTSIKDDNLPPGGDDTNGDGNATIPNNSDWRSIHFTSTASTSSRLEHCTLWFGGYFQDGVVRCEGVSPTIEDCEINAGYNGVLCFDADPTIRNTTINACTSVPVAISIDSEPVFDSVAFGSTSNNGFDAIGILGTSLASGISSIPIRGTTIGGSSISNVTYLLLADITIDPGATLTISPGVVIKCLNPGVDILVDGTLNAAGTADPDSTIAFTSFRDDALGTPDDTNNDGSTTAPSANDWGGISFRSGSSGAVDHCIVRYGGFGTYKSNVRMHDVAGAVSVSNSTISDSNYGLEIAGLSQPAVTGNNFSNATRTPVLMSVSAEPTFSGNTFTANGLTALGLINETIGVDSRLGRRNVAGFTNITYYLVGNLTMGGGALLTLDPGVVVKLAAFNTNIDINGGLWAVAPSDPDSVIVFTAERDDAHGNPSDTNGDGSATVPSAGDWGHVRFDAAATDSVSRLDNCFVGYGGTDGPGANIYEGTIWCNGSSPTIQNTEFQTCYIAVRCDGASAAIVTDNNFLNSTDVPVIVSPTSSSVIERNTYATNGFHALGLLSETLAANATLALPTAGVAQFGVPFPYYLTQGKITVGTNSVLTIDPGVILKMKYFALDIDGGLLADGTSSPIVFTDIKDDAHGGDSNVDGSLTSPVNSDWDRILFADTSDDVNCRLIACEFWYGGAGIRGVVQMINASPTIDGSSFEFNGDGIWVEGLSSPTITNNLIRQSTDFPIVIDLIATAAFAGNTFDGNGYTALGIKGGSLSQDATLPVRNVAGFNNITYALDSVVTVQFGARLTIEPGVVIKAYWTGLGDGMTISGELVADGDLGNEIVFTSIEDDAHGNPADTNGDGGLSTPAAGEWASLEFSDVSVDVANVLDHCVLRYGGRSSSRGMLHTESASPAISNCTIERSNFDGMRCDGASNPTVTGCTFIENLRTPLALTLSADPTLSGNTLSNNVYDAIGVIGETLAQDTTWRRRAFAGDDRREYVLTSNLFVGTAANLTIEPGVVIKPLQSVSLYVRRGLIAEGTADPESLIVFTSPRDDFYGGDTNGDGTATDGTSFRWGAIFVESTALNANVRFANCVFAHATAVASQGAVVVQGSLSPSFTNCIFQNNTVGINYTQSSGNPALGTVTDCDFFDNSLYAIRNTGMAHVVSAESSWWGDDSGPLDDSDDTVSGGLYNPGGLGDPVTDGVDYSPWEGMGLQNFLMGDVSLNGAVRAFDASLVLRWLVADTTLTAQQQTIGDVTCTAGLTAFDASLILQYVAALITTFPCLEREAADPGLVAAIDDFDLTSGARVSVPVRLVGSGAVHATQLIVRSSTNAVQIVGVEASELDATMRVNVDDGGRARLALASLEPLGETTLGRVIVEVAADPAGGTTAVLEFDLAMADETDVTARSSPGHGIAPGTHPMAYALAQNAPNPIGRRTTFRFEIPGSARRGAGTELVLYDVGGRRVRTLVREVRAPGVHRVEWDGTDEVGRRVAPGVYFYRLRSGEFGAEKKMVVR